MGSLVSFPLDRRLRPANSNEVATGIVCQKCQINVFAIMLIDDELEIECALCRRRVTDGVLSYLDREEPQGA